MPGWHEATRELQAAGRLQMLGIIQEQHPDRARLFMRWKEMGWPLLVDSYDLLEIDVVPLTLAIDEHGVIRRRGLRVGDAARIEADFLDREYASGDGAETRRPPGSRLPAPPPLGSTGEDWRRYGDRLATFGGEARLDEAIAAYERALELDPEDGWASFRRGVALRQRYDGPHRRPGDFQAAVDAWSRALETDPNNYIWRRRIQQYGPRLAKPYPFYDWVQRARQEIEDRGEPVPELRVEPRGSELAKPARDLGSASSGRQPDRQGRIHRDDGLIALEATAVPARAAPGEAVMLHLVFRPVEARRAHWNNEVDPVQVWLDPPAGWQVASRLREIPLAAAPVSHEERRLEVEIRSGEGVTAGPAELGGYALYYVCEDVDGTCLYRRSDFSVPIRVVP